LIAVRPLGRAGAVTARPGRSLVAARARDDAEADAGVEAGAAVGALVRAGFCVEVVVAAVAVEPDAPIDLVGRQTPLPTPPFRRSESALAR